MSHLIEEYAKNLGVKISHRPVMFGHFWPLPFDKFIVINSGADVSSKTYKHFNLVLDMLSPVLNGHGIHIIQIGSSNDTKLNNISLRLVDLNPRQIAYIVGKSMLYLGSDGVWSHYANSKEIPIVTLHGNAFSALSNGAWYSDQINLEGAWEKCPPLSAHDAHRSIDKIKPEDICFACCKLLNIPYKNKLKTLYIGKIFGEPIVEIIPNFSPNERFDNENSYFLRCDYTDDLFLEDWCFHLPRFSVFLSKKTNLSILSKYKNKIDSLLFEVDKSDQETQNFVRSFSTIGKNTILLTNNKSLSKIRNQWFDYKVLPKNPQDDVALPANTPIVLASSKMVVDKNGKYASLYHRKRGIAGVEKLLSVKANPELLQEAEHFVFFEKNS